MDDPDPRRHRALTADWFQPSSLARLEGRLADLARRAVDRMADAGGECDFANWSANRDEDVFDDPFRFDVGRKPNRHLAFGFGAHYCLGAALAKMEIRALFAELIPRLEWIEPAGPAELSRSIFVGGHKHLPIRYRLR